MSLQTKIVAAWSLSSVVVLIIVGRLAGAPEVLIPRPAPAGAPVGSGAPAPCCALGAAYATCMDGDVLFIAAYSYCTAYSSSSASTPVPHLCRARPADCSLKSWVRCPRNKLRGPWPSSEARHIFPCRNRMNDKNISQQCGCLRQQHVRATQASSALYDFTRRGQCRGGSPSQAPASLTRA